MLANSKLMIHSYFYLFFFGPNLPFLLENVFGKTCFQKRINKNREVTLYDIIYHGVYVYTLHTKNVYIIVKRVADVALTK